MVWRRENPWLSSYMEKFIIWEDLSAVYHKHGVCIRLLDRHNQSYLSSLSFISRHTTSSRLSRAYTTNPDLWQSSHRKTPWPEYSAIFYRPRCYDTHTSRLWWCVGRTSRAVLRGHQSHAPPPQPELLASGGFGGAVLPKISMSLRACVAEWRLRACGWSGVSSAVVRRGMLRILLPAADGYRHTLLPRQRKRLSRTISHGRRHVHPQRRTPLYTTVPYPNL
jgi:hypothetical protein